MKTRVFFQVVVIVFSILLIGTIASVAQAQSQDGYNICDLMSMSPTTGTAGTTVNLSGSGLPGASEVTINWDGSSLTTIPIDGSGNFSGSFTVPADAAAGDHTVSASTIFLRVSVTCPFTFTVTSVRSDAYSPSVLPATGLMLMVPAVGVAFAGLGSLIMRRRRR